MLAAEGLSPGTLVQELLALRPRLRELVARNEALAGAPGLCDRGLKVALRWFKGALWMEPAAGTGAVERAAGRWCRVHG